MSLYNLERAKVKIERLAKKYAKRKVAFRVLVRELNEEFRSLKVHFESRINKDVSGGILFEGYYHNKELRDQLGCIYHFTIHRDRKMTSIKPRRHGFFRELQLNLAHEFRHGYQHRRRKYKRTRRDIYRFKHFNKHIQNHVSYLVDYDEIDAYAFEAAEELQYKGWSFADLHKTTVYRMMYGKHVNKYAPHHFKRWACKVYQHLNKKSK